LTAEVPEVDFKDLPIAHGECPLDNFDALCTVFFAGDWVGSAIPNSKN